jgi:DNA-binding NarL/FixJ family response regulator
VASTVFVVDDAADLRLLFTMSLRRNGYEVLGEAATGEQAIAAALDLRPDVVLIDLMLPDMTGLDVVTALRDALPTTKLVMCSGMEEPETIDACLDAGANGYIGKGEAADIGSALTKLLDAS